MESQIPLINPITGQVCVAVLIFSTTIAFFLRMYVRIYVNRTFCWDDGWLIASQFFLLVIAGLYFEISNTYNDALENHTDPPNDRLNIVSCIAVDLSTRMANMAYSSLSLALPATVLEVSVSRFHSLSFSRDLPRDDGKSESFVEVLYST